MDEIRRVLNVGGNNKAIPLPDHFQGWAHVLLGIDPKGKPDLVCDARELKTLEPDQYDAIYCSHNLEHYYRHDLSKVLSGFVHVLKPSGFAHIRVPDLMALCKTIVEKNLDIDDVLYTVPGGPVHVFDVLYGWQQQIAGSGEAFLARKYGFSEKSLFRHLHAHGFGWIAHSTGSLEVTAFAFVEEPDRDYFQALKLPFALN